MNEKQRDGMERAGETGEIIDRRAGERRAAAPVVAVVAADLSSLTLYSPTWSDRELTELSGTQAAMEVDNAMGKYVLLADVQALASQAQAAVSARVGGFVLQARSPEGDPWQDVSADDFHKAAANGYETRVISAGLAAQAAVGVASQQEQQPVPSCMPPTRGTGSRVDAADSTQLAWEPVTHAGQVKEGDKLRFTIGDKSYKERARLILHAGSDKEEVVYDIARNFYFITSMVLNGRGNHKRVEVLARRFRAPGGNTNDKASPDLASIASQAQGDELDAKRWRFMMRVADDDAGPEAMAMERFGNGLMESDRPESLQMNELVDRAIASLTPTES